MDEPALAMSYRTIVPLKTDHRWASFAIEATMNCWTLSRMLVSFPTLLPLLRPLVFSTRTSQSQKALR